MNDSILDRIGSTLEKGVGGAEKLGSGIGTLLAQLGGDYLPRDPGGMEMTDQQRRGLLQAQIRDRRYGPAATSGNVDAFMNRARGNQSIASMRSAINSMPEISEDRRKILLALPPAQQMSFMEEMMTSELAPGTANSSLTPQIFEKPDGTMVFGQLDNRGSGVTFPDGTTYDPVKYPEQSKWKFIGNSMSLSTERQGDIADASAYGRQVGETRGLFEQYTDPAFAQAELDFNRLVELPLQEELLRLERQSAAGEQVDAAQISRLTDSLADSKNAFSRVTTAKDQQELLGGLFDQARANVGSWTTGLAGAKLGDIAGTDAYDLKQTISTIQANVGFDKLQSMRQLSKTGGALGSVSEKELALLTGALGSLDTAQSQEQFLAQLDRVEEQIANSWARVTEAFEQEYGVSYFDDNAQQTIESFVQSKLDALVNPSDLRGRGVNNPVNPGEAQRIFQEQLDAEIARRFGSN